MIYIKTKMQKLPMGCINCPWYVRGTETIYERPACRAVSAYKEHGKPINPSWRREIEPSKARPKWCPLREEEQE